MTTTSIPVISNWSVAFGYKLQGQVTGRKGFEDGSNILTSYIVGRTREGKVRTKSGNEYVLGEVDQEYEELFPGARERLFNSLQLLDGELS